MDVELRWPCEHGEYKPHRQGGVGDPWYCTKSFPVTGETIWWCEEHRTLSVPNDLNPALVINQCWWAKTFEPKPCRMVERLLVSLP